MRNGSQSPDRWDTLIPLDVGTSLTVQTVAESNNIKNGGLEDYNNISDGIFPQCTTQDPLYKDKLRVRRYLQILSNFNAFFLKQSAQLFMFSWIGIRENKNIFLLEIF